MEDAGSGAVTDFLAMLAPADAVALHEVARAKRFRAGQTLMHEGQLGEEVLILLAGRVKVSSTTREGKEIVLRFGGPGDLLGEMSVIDSRPRSGTIEALEPGEALAIAGSEFRAFLGSRPQVAMQLLRIVIRRFRDADLKRIEFAAAQTLGRVAARIVELAERYGEASAEGIAIDLRISQEELAGWTGSSREAAVKALHTLRELSLISTERRRITVFDLEGLRRQAA